jgi:hypothetical protein
MIVCTQDDKNFFKFKDKVNCRKVRFTIKQIFSDWWDDFVEKHPKLKIRDVVFKNVRKILCCKTFFLGYSVFVCPTCNKELVVPHTCKSRFCSSCGNKYNEERSISIFSKLINYKHRHVVFTIPEELRIYFREDRDRLNLLFKASSITIKYWFKNKHKGVTPAFVSTLHTFGRSLIWNPHIHIILLDGGISKDKFVKVDFFSYASFRKRFMKVILDLLEEDIGKERFKRIKNNMYHKYFKEGFYVYAPPSKYKNFIELIKYVTRYVARPVMAKSRIIDYDGTYVTFWYQRHEDDKIVIEKIHAYEFIAQLIKHIPNPNFKYIRFYGAYHNSTKISIELSKIDSKEKTSFKRSLNKWRCKLMISFGLDPLKCSVCDSTMVYSISVYT